MWTYRYFLCGGVGGEKLCVEFLSLPLHAGAPLTRGFHLSTETHPCHTAHMIIQPQNNATDVLITNACKQENRLHANCLHIFALKITGENQNKTFDKFSKHTHLTFYICLYSVKIIAFIFCCCCRSVRH